MLYVLSTPCLVKAGSDPAESVFLHSNTKKDRTSCVTLSGQINVLFS